jgi:hypothetical protein
MLVAFAVVDFLKIASTVIWLPVTSTSPTDTHRRPAPDVFIEFCPNVNIVMETNVRSV